MIKEGQQPPEQIDLKPLLILGGVFLLSQFAFSWKSKQIIVQRDGGRSVISGETEDLEAAHIDHDKSKEHYDDPKNGRLLTTEEHLRDHINRAGRNGLTKAANDWAIRMLKQRLGIDD